MCFLCIISRYALGYEDRDRRSEAQSLLARAKGFLLSRSEGRLSEAKRRLGRSGDGRGPFRPWMAKILQTNQSA
jgi:hypothetical protein